MADGTKKLLYLESIRGTAAMVVVFDHLMLSFRPDVWDPRSPGVAAAAWPVRLLVTSPLSFLYRGSFAVAVFFVLSGFVLSYSYFRSSRPDAVTAPALRRYFRLMVPSLVSVLGAYALLRAGLFDNRPAGLVTGSPWLGTWYGFRPSLLGLREDGAVYQAVYGLFAGQSVAYNNVLWTMRVELVGSFLVYALLALFGRVRHRWVVYGVAGGLLVAAGHVDLLAFVIGVAACDAYTRGDRAAADVGRWGWLVLAAGLALGGYQGLPLPVLRRAIPGSNYHQVIGAAMVILAPLVSASVRRPLDYRPVAFLGRISFGLYLVHVPVICSLGCRTFLRLVAGGWGQNAATAVAAVASVAVSLFLGWVMYHVADRPSIWIGRRVSDLFTGGRPAGG